MATIKIQGNPNNNTLTQQFLNALIGTPDQTVNLPQRQVRTGYYDPLVQQVDYLNQNQQDMTPYEQRRWNQVGYDQIRRNAAEGKNSGLPNIENARVNLGLEANQPAFKVEGGLQTVPGDNGFLTDLMGGFNENYNTAFNKENTLNNSNKGVATRIGEGLGTVARNLNKPLGRAAIAYGLTRALGGGNDISAVNALTAGITNQNLRTQDQIYRQGLEEQGYDTSNLNGWVTDDLYQNYSNSYYKLRDLQRREESAQVYNELTKLRAQKQAIENSALPELQKAKLIQENAKAQYAAEMQLARIQAYQNTAALGWGRLGLQQAGLDIRRQEAADKREERQAKIDAIRQLTSDSGGSAATPKSDPLGIR